MSVGGREEPDEPVTIRRASELLQVPTPTIRSWERRYAIPCVSRTSGGHRRYTSDQLRMLQHMRDAIARGHRAVAAAALVKAAEESSPQTLVQTFLEAAGRLQPVELGDVLDRAHQTLGLGRTIDEVLLPAMRQVGLRWEDGRCDVVHEHLATEAVRGWLAVVSRSAFAPRHGRPIILACGPLDAHTVGLECMAALLSSKGHECRVLGARTPAASLLLAIVETQPAAVIVVSQMARGRRAAARALAQAAEHCESFYAGEAFCSSKARAATPGTYLGTRLEAAASVVGQAVSAGA